MSAIKVIRALLLADAATLAITPASNIIAGVLPQGSALPALAITEVSRTDRNILSPGSHARSTARVQVTIFTTSYPAQKALLQAVRHACRDKRGTVAGIQNVAVLLDGTGPDFNDSDTSFFMQTQDFMVGYTEPT